MHGHVIRPDDPNWMLAQRAPAQNWMGRVGASAGRRAVYELWRGFWGLGDGGKCAGLGFAVLALHRGQERAWPSDFRPIAHGAGRGFSARQRSSPVRKMGSNPQLCLAGLFAIR